MPRHADWMKRWESFRYIVDALRAYIDRNPLRVETEPDWPLVVELASKQLVSPTIGLVLHDPLGGQFGGSGFLAHLHSTMVTMSQKSSVLQPAKSDDVDGLSSTASKCQSVVARSATMRETVRGKIYQNWRLISPRTIFRSTPWRAKALLP
jgi:hypothetical protein